MRKLIMLFVLGCTALSVFSTELAPPLPLPQTHYFNVVQQTKMADGTIGTQNYLQAYTVGEELVQEGSSCWKLTTTKIGTKPVAVTLLAGRVETVVMQERPVLKIVRESAPCVATASTLKG